MKLKIGVISDTHLGRVTKDLKGIYERYLSDKDLVLHAGDVISTDIIDYLNRGNFHGVYGNMDPFEVRELLPAKKIIELGRFRLGLIHGWGASAGLEDRIRSEFRDVDVIIYGHSHHAANHRKKGVLFFNPGTASGYTSSGIHSIGALELNDTIHGEIIRL